MFLLSFATGKFDAGAARLDNVFLSNMEPVELFNDGSAAFSETLSAETPSVKIEISRPEGILGLRLRNPLGMGAREHIVLAEPLLSKR